MNDDNNFSRMIQRFKYYRSKNKTQFHLQLIATAAISIILIGQLGASRDYFSGVTDHMTKNPFMILWHAITMFPFTLGLFLLLNIAIIILVTNMKDNLYDTERNFQISEKGTMGTGGFMKAEDKQKALYMDTIENTNGMILGKDPDTGLVLSPKETLYLNGHKYVCGGSGARKTTTQVLNDLYQYIKANESFIVTDPKGEIYGMLAGMCKNHGYNVKVLNLVNFNNSDALDFVKCCRDANGDQDVEVKNVMTLVAVIMANTSDKDEAGFWKDQQTGLLTAAILYVMYDHTGLTEPTLGGAYNFIINNTLSELERKFRNLDPTHPARIQISDFLDSKEDIQSSAKLGLKQRLQILQLNSVQQIISRDEIDLVEPGRTKCAYFLIMSDQERTFDFISSLFFCMFFIKIVAYADSRDDLKTEVPVHVEMDEFPSIGTILDLSRKFATLRSRQVLITIIFQNIGQVMDKYEKHEWQTILSNCDIGIYLGGNDSEETAKFFLNRIGEMTVISKGVRKEESIFSPTGNRFYPTNTVTESETRRPVMTVDEFMRMPLDEAIVLLKSNRPLKVLKFVHTEHPYAKELVKLNATNHIPDWRRISEGYPLEFTDNELAPIIKEMLANRQMAQYLADRAEDRTYNFLTYLAENRPDIFPTYRDLYDERVREEEERAGKTSTVHGSGESGRVEEGTENPSDIYTQDYSSVRSTAAGSTGNVPYASSVNSHTGSLGANTPAASSSPGSSPGSVSASEGTKPKKPLPTMTPLTSGLSGISGAANTGNAGSKDRSARQTSPTVPPTLSSMGSPAAGTQAPSTSSSHGTGEANGAPANMPTLSGAAGAGTTPPRRSARPRRVLTKIDPKATDDDEQNEQELKGPEAGEDQGKKHPNPSAPEVSEASAQPPVTETAPPNTPDTSSSAEAGKSDTADTKKTSTSKDAAKGVPPKPGNKGSARTETMTGNQEETSIPSATGSDTENTGSGDIKAKQPSSEQTNQSIHGTAEADKNIPAVSSAQKPNADTLETAATHEPSDPDATSANSAGSNAGNDRPVSPSPEEAVQQEKQENLPNATVRSDRDKLKSQKSNPDTPDTLTSDAEVEIAGTTILQAEKTEEASEKHQTGPGTAIPGLTGFRTLRSLKPVQPDPERETRDPVPQETVRTESATPAAGAAASSTPAKPASSVTVPADLTEASGQTEESGTEHPVPSDPMNSTAGENQSERHSGSGSDQEASESQSVHSGTAKTPEPPAQSQTLTKTNFRMFDINAASPSPEKNTDGAPPVIHHEVGIKRKGDTRKKGLKKVNPSEH